MFGMYMTNKDHLEKRRQELLVRLDEIGVGYPIAQETPLWVAYSIVKREGPITGEVHYLSLAKAVHKVKKAVDAWFKNGERVKGLLTDFEAFWATLLPGHKPDNHPAVLGHRVVKAWLVDPNAVSDEMLDLSLQILSFYTPTSKGHEG